MSVLYSTTGIVLSRRDFKEADRSYCVLTAEYGKIEFLARGGHKPLAKLTPHLEMAAEVDLLIVHGRAFETVAGVERKERFVDSTSSLSQLLLVQNSLALVDLATRLNECDFALYGLVRSWLDFVRGCREMTDERAAFLLGSFTLKLMSTVGYRPELSACLSCRRQIESQSYRWHALKGGVVCQSCSVQNEQQWFSARLIDDETLKLLRFALQRAFPEQLRPHLRGEQIERFHEVLESYLICHFPTIPAVSIRSSCFVSPLHSEAEIR